MDKKLLKEAFEAGRDYQYSINPYSGKPMNKFVLSFTKWYNRKVKELNIPDVVWQSEQFTCKNPLEICTWFEGGIVTVDRQYPCDKCK